jgi:hypothetical protein
MPRSPVLGAEIIPVFKTGLESTTPKLIRFWYVGEGATIPAHGSFEFAIGHFAGDEQTFPIVNVHLIEPGTG